MTTATALNESVLIKIYCAALKSSNQCPPYGRHQTDILWCSTSYEEHNMNEESFLESCVFAVNSDIATKIIVKHVTIDSGRMERS